MKTNYVSLNNPLLEFIEDTGLDQEHMEVPETTLKRWAIDCLGWINTEEQLAHRICILQVHNTRAKLPDDYKLLAQAAAHPWYEREECDCEKYPEHDCCGHYDGKYYHYGDGKHQYNKNEEFPFAYPKTRREDIIQWTKNAFEKECELEINLICPNCKKTGCDCNAGSVEVDVDRIWEMAHPEIYYRNYNKIGRVGHGPGPWSSFYSPKFKIMRYATNDYFNVQNILTHCPNLNCKASFNEFILDLPYIEVDFKRGEVLLSYLGRQMDENGDPLIPDHPSVFAAIQAHLQYKWYHRIFLRKGDKIAFQAAQLAKQEREQEIGYANSYLGIPEYSQFYSWMEQNLMRRIPDYNHRMNANKITLDPAVRYNNLLDSNNDIYNDYYKKRHI